MTAQIRRLEEELSDARSNVNAKEIELENLQNRLRQLEDHNQHLISENGQFQNELERNKMEIERANSSRNELEESIEKLKGRLEEHEQNLKELRNTIAHLKSDVLVNWEIMKKITFF